MFDQPPRAHVQVWKLGETGKLTAVTTLKHAEEVTSVTFSPDGMFLASASTDSTARVYEAGCTWEEQVPLHPRP